MEAVLLFCAVLVNLAGIMFESGRFESSYYDGQRDLITYIVMFIVFASILYFVVVFCAEAFGVCTPGCLKKPKKLTREEIKQQKMEMTGRRQSIAVFQVRPPPNRRASALLPARAGQVRAVARVPGTHACGVVWPRRTTRC